VLLLLPPAARSGSSSASSRARGVAVVLASGSEVAVNTGWPLGPAVARQTVLRARGYCVVSVPLSCWLPAWLRQHIHQQQQVERQVEQQAQQQQARSSQRGRLLVARHKHLRRLAAAVRALGAVAAD
jgi:predicted MFS family arabinose efflux permease